MSEPTRPAVVATAGHVDHGKSSLIVRLTGTDPDRLAEEKRRGLTIELGYAWCTLPSGREIGFVDVPGHERFVRTMLAGVGPVRLVLFVVAADEGWKPQSEEHLAILDALGVDGSVIALTKRDLVGAGELERAIDEVGERVAGTALEGATVVPCSSATGEGLDELAAALDTMLAAAPDPEREGRPRWFLDRVFTMRGAGTVATGTLTGGPLATGDEVEIHPSGARARIRGLQTHRRDVQIAVPVSRVAANLAGVDRERVERGDVVTRPGAWRPTAVLEARLVPVRSASRPMTARGAFTLHAGSAERVARVRLYGASSVGPEGAFARIRLASPLVLDVGDRFVIRESGRRETVAGGLVLDVDPPPRPGPDPAARLGARLAAPRERLPALVVAERGAVRADALGPLTGLEPADITGARRVGGWWVADSVDAEVARALEEHLAAFHASDPLAAGEDLAALRPVVLAALRRAGGPADPALGEALVEALVQTGRLAREGTRVRLAAHVAQAPDEDRERLLAAVREREPTPPSVSELVELGFGRSLIDATVRSGALVRITPELVLSAAIVERAIELIERSGEAGITVSALREALGTSRRYAVPLLEHLDRTGVTRRRGDLRFLRRRDLSGSEP
jgi:selenocysteine-specific elongation factor